MTRVLENDPVAVVSAHPLYRCAVVEMLRRRGVNTVECVTPAQLVVTARSRAVGTVFVDLDHADKDVAEFLAYVRGILPEARVVPLGELLRQAAALVDPEMPGIEPSRADGNAVYAATNSHRRRPPAELIGLTRLWAKLTPRQRVVMANLAIGRDNRAIAHELGVGERAVKAHVSALLAMFGLANRTELALLALRAGLRPPES